MRFVDLINEKKERERREQNVKDAKKLALGSVIGVVAGVLLAPKSGKETRQDIVDKTKETSNTAKNSIKESANTIKEAKGKIAEDVKHRIDEFKDRDMFEVEINKSEIDEEKDDSDFADDVEE